MRPNFIFDEDEAYITSNGKDKHWGDLWWGVSAGQGLTGWGAAQDYRLVKAHPKQKKIRPPGALEWLIDVALHFEPFKI